MVESLTFLSRTVIITGVPGSTNAPGLMLVVVKVVDGADMDLEQMLKDGKIAAYVVVPAGFSANASSPISASAGRRFSMPIRPAKPRSLG